MAGRAMWGVAAVFLWGCAVGTEGSSGGTGDSAGGHGGDGENGGSGGSAASASGSGGELDWGVDGGSGSEGTGSSGTGAGSPGGNGSCISCTDLMNQGGDPAQLCTSDGSPSSAQRFDAFMQCTCVDACGQPCQSACGGAQPDQACQQCVQSSCSSQMAACMDPGGGGSADPPGCTKCSAALSGSGDPASICPSSAPKWDAFGQCACQSGCPQPCAAPCNGYGPPDASCQGCLDVQCGAELQACLGDV